jgi:hypothetical protein
VTTASRGYRLASLRRTPMWRSISLCMRFPLSRRSGRKGLAQVDGVQSTLVARDVPGPSASFGQERGVCRASLSVWPDIPSTCRNHCLFAQHPRCLLARHTRATRHLPMASWLTARCRCRRCPLRRSWLPNAHVLGAEPRRVGERLPIPLLVTIDGLRQFFLEALDSIVLLTLPWHLKTLSQAEHRTSALSSLSPCSPQY